MGLTRFARAALLLVTIFLLVAIYGPILVTVAGAFLPIKAGMIQGLDFSLDAFRALAGDENLIRSLVVTLIVGAAATLASVVLSVGFALFAVERGGWHGRIVPLIIFVPFVMPPMVTGLSLLIFARDIEVERSLFTVVIGHVLIILAVAYRTIAVRLVELGQSLTEASLDLGATRWQTFVLVILPNIRGAIAAAAALCFALSFDETLITLLLTGTESTFPVRLWGMTRLGITPAANAILAILLVLTLAVAATAIAVLEKRSRKAA